MAESIDIRELNIRIEQQSQFVTNLVMGMNKVIVGQKHLVDCLLIGLLSDGHILLEGVPGLAKTLAIKTLSQLISADFSRIQFTPDLLPADVVGTQIYSQKDETFHVKKGPVFANFVLADEINRAPAKVQSALLEFISGRPNDNIGLTIFAGEAFTQCPMTTDHASLLRLLQDTRTDITARGLIDDGTAVGMGLANAVSRLKDSKSKSKVVILLTDGSNNTGDISPMTAAEIAKSFGIRVYTIGVGTNKVAPYPMPTAAGVQYVNMPVEIDTETLRDIARTTDGNFYRATNNAELKRIYHDIDKLEKTKMNVTHFAKRYEAYQPFALAALLVLLAEILLRITWLRRIP